MRNEERSWGKGRRETELILENFNLWNQENQKKNSLEMIKKYKINDIVFWETQISHERFRAPYTDRYCWLDRVAEITGCALHSPSNELGSTSSDFTPTTTNCRLIDERIILIKTDGWLNQSPASVQSIRTIPRVSANTYRIMTFNEPYNYSNAPSLHARCIIMRWNGSRLSALLFYYLDRQTTAKHDL